MPNPCSTEVSCTNWWHNFLPFEKLLQWAQHWARRAYVFFASDSWPADNTENVINKYIDVFELIFLHNYELEFHHQGLKSYNFTSERLFNRKTTNLDLCVGILKVQRCQKVCNIFDMSLYSNSHLFIIMGYNSSVKILIDSFNSLELSSNWICLIFAESTDFSWSAENAEKCNCYCYFVEIQIHNFLELVCDMTLRAQV